MTIKDLFSTGRSSYSSYAILLGICLMLFWASPGFATSNTCAISPAASYIYPVCTAPSGSITMAPTGGVAPYRYRWSNHDTTARITGLASGTYTVTVTDARQCTVVRTFNLTPYIRVLTLSTATKGDTCNAGIGSATVTVNGTGISAYTYEWSNGATTATASGLTAGTYTVTVIDPQNCSATASATVTNIGTAIVQNGTISQPLCPISTGAIHINPSGGTASVYSVVWSNGATTDTISNLTSGTYTATVHGRNGCTNTASYVVNTPPAPIVITGTATPPLCSGGRGSISITSSGGTGPTYTAVWSNGATGMTATNLLAGSYTVTVTDSKGCTAAKAFTVNQGPVINPLATITSPICTSADGVIQMTPANGQTPYRYSWSSGDTSTIKRNLAAGTYLVTVTDANSCTAAQSFTLTAYMRPVTLSTATISDTCSSGKGNASVTVTSTASTAPFTYAWANGHSTSSISGLTPASYIVSVTDANGCIGSTSATVSNYISTITIMGSITSPICINPNGTISVTSVTGGKAPYSYKWNTAATASNLSSLAAGTYTVSVTDANSCTAAQSFTVAAFNTPISASVSAIGDTCTAHIGQVSARVSGGTAPMSYAWSTGGTADTIKGLGARYYTVTVTDLNGCTTTAGASVSNLGTPIAISATVSQPPCHKDSGTIAISVTGGTSSVYNLLWSNGATGNSITSLTGGVYTLNVSGTNSCTASQTYTIIVPDSINLQYAITPVKCDSAMGGTITETQFTGATYPWTMSWTGPNSYASASMDINHLSSGTYSYTLTDSKGCIAHGNYVINKTGWMSASYIVANTSCPGVNNGSIQRQSLTLYSTPTFQWTGPNDFTSDSTSIKNLAPGVYSLLITQAYGCIISLTDTVYSGPAVSLVYASTPVKCDSAKGGTLTKTGAVNTYYPWTMSWAGPNGFTSTQTNLINVAGGSYSLSFTDSRGCSATQNFTVDSFGALSAKYTTSPITCLGASNGSISYVSLTPYSSQAKYNWTGPAAYTDTTQSISGLSPGTYAVTVSENYGCKVSDTFALAQQFDVGVSSIKNINCPAANIHMIIHPIAGDMSQLSGNHCASGVSGQVIMTITGAVHYEGVDSGSLVPSIVHGDTLIWNIADFGTVRIDSSFFVKLHVDTNVVLGSQICVKVQVMPYAGDYDTANNVMSYCMTVIVAYDPNSKQVFPQGNISPAQKELTYTVQFQNTGTGPAHHVFIMDTLDTNIDPSSFKVLASSYPVQPTNNAGALRFDFSNIDLAPAAQDSAASIGWVQYSVILRSGLAVGTSITNTANIYFDYNSPMATNTTVNTISDMTTGVADAGSDSFDVLLYPDPARDYVFIRASHDLTGGHIEIYDITGRKCKDQLISDSRSGIQIKDLPIGVYLINIIFPSGINTCKKLLVE